MAILRSLAVWCLIMALETVHGVLRGMFAAPALGDVAANRIGWPIGLAIVYGTAIALNRWMGLHSTRAQLAAGLLWALLTFAFEFGIGLLRGLPVAAVVEEFNPLSGGLGGLSVLAMLLCPLVAARLRS